MANSFPRTTRSLQLDGFGFSLTLLMVSIALILAWMVWFFQAPIAMYEISKEVTVQEDGTIIVLFPAARMERMAPGQNAVLQIQGRFQNGEMDASDKENGEERTISAKGVVMKIVPPDSGDSQGQAELMLTDETAYTVIFQQPKGASSFKYQAQIEIESVTPFILIQRAARQYFASAQTAPNSAAPNN